ncbi:hypothetical protein JQ600_07395 [Bradyrhizobium sp. AUGA SZCCT0176]|nr:hypothetical protein [Bradyrhizobium sp. AUGA SZCCT0176]MBR1299780.1 hypothetical protein [Bradyrhizobium sp. AUGA SZCCT0042]
MSSTGELAAAAELGISFSILVIYLFSLFSCARRLGLGVDGLGEVRMPCHQQAEIDEVKHQELRQPRGGDIGGTQIVAQSARRREGRQRRPANRDTASNCPPARLRGKPGGGMNFLESRQIVVFSPHIENSLRPLQ